MPLPKKKLKMPPGPADEPTEADAGVPVTAALRRAVEAVSGPIDSVSGSTDSTAAVDPTR